MTPKTNREKVQAIKAAKGSAHITGALRFIMDPVLMFEVGLTPEAWQTLDDAYQAAQDKEFVFNNTTFAALSAKREEGNECPKKGPEEPEQRETDYLKHGGAKCPYCESNDIEAGHMEWTSSGSAFQEVNCNDCGKEWKDLYNLTSVEFED